MESTVTFLIPDNSVPVQFYLDVELVRGQDEVHEVGLLQTVTKDVDVPTFENAPLTFKLKPTKNFGMGPSKNDVTL